MWTAFLDPYTEVPESILTVLQLLPILLLGIRQSTISLVTSLCGTSPAARASELAVTSPDLTWCCLLWHRSPPEFDFFQKTFSFFSHCFCLLAWFTDLLWPEKGGWIPARLPGAVRWVLSLPTLTAPPCPWVVVTCLLTQLVYIFSLFLFSSFLVLWSILLPKLRSSFYFNVV